MTGAVEARAVMARHARTFSAAAAVLAPDTHDEIARVYQFCRVVDDLADETGDAAALERLSAELEGREPPSPLANLILDLGSRGVPVEAAVHLVAGVRSDLGPVRIADERALVWYSYLVAGTVGRLVCPLLGVRDPAAIRFAIDLGIGMQLTNIARDVGEDAARGRVYLPETWLAEAGLGPEDVLRGGRDAEVARVVARVLDLAEVYYASGFKGLRYLPWRARWAVALAGRRYRGIGWLVRRRGVAAVRERAALGPLARLGYALTAPFWAMWAGFEAPGPHRRELHAPLDPIRLLEST